jgi:hypothetical protein
MCCHQVVVLPTPVDECLVHLLQVLPGLRFPRSKVFDSVKHRHMQVPTTVSTLRVLSIGAIVFENQTP